MINLAAGTTGSHISVWHTVHSAMIHALHLSMAPTTLVAMIHCSHTAAHCAHHVAHRVQPFRRINGRYRCFKTCPCSQRTASVAGAVHGLCKNGISVVFRLHQYIVGFAWAEAELVDSHRLHIDAIGLNNRQLQARDAHIIKAVGGTIDKPQPDALTGAE